MHNKLLIVLAIILASCSDREHESAAHEEHNLSFTYTAYNDHYELFIDSPMAIAGEPVKLLCHFTRLDNFKPLDSAMVVLKHEFKGISKADTVSAPLRKGIFEFEVSPDKAGIFNLVFNIITATSTSEIKIDDFTVFNNEEEAESSAETKSEGSIYTVPFTKEYSWKLDFATGFPSYGPFGRIIKTTAVFQPTQESQLVVSAKTSGIAVTSQSNVIAGNSVKKDELLLTITGSDLADDNITLRAGEIKNHYEKTRSDYERTEKLAKDRIVSEKDLLAARTEFENAKAAFENLHEVGTTGMRITSPMNGYIREVLFANGSFVSEGQPLLIISRNTALSLTAEVPLKFASELGTIETANIRVPGDDRTYSLEELGGKILSFGKSAGNNSYLIPVMLQISNSPGYTPGSIAEVYLKTVDGQPVVTVPNSSLIEEQGVYYVWVQITPELFEKREVTKVLQMESEQP